MKEKFKYFWVSDTLSQHYAFVRAYTFEIANEIGEYLFKECFLYQLEDSKGEKDIEKYIKHFDNHKVVQGYITVFSIPPHAYKTRRDIVDEILKDL